MRARRYRFLLFFVLFFLALFGDHLLVSHVATACPVGTKILIDNGQSGYSETGNDWASWGSNNQAIGKDYRYLSKTVGGSDRKGTAKWVPTLPTAGIYKISAIFRATVNRTYDADYFVTDSSGKSHHVVVDQRDGAKSESDSHGPVYSSLGSHHLAPGKGQVLLDGTDDDLSDEADAVQFELVSCDAVPAPDGSPPDDLGLFPTEDQGVQPSPDQGVQPSPDTTSWTDGLVPQPTNPGGPGSPGCECTTGGADDHGLGLALIVLLGLWWHRRRSRAS